MKQNNLDIFKIKNYTDVAGQVYGTEDICMFLYSYVKMTKPETIIELGTGLGCCTFWMAQALKEINQGGRIITYDNGSQWDEVEQKHRSILYKIPYYNYESYLTTLVYEFKLDEFITFKNQDVDYNYTGHAELVVSNFNHSVNAGLYVVGNYLDSNTILYLNLPNHNETKQAILDYYKRVVIVDVCEDNKTNHNGLSIIKEIA